MRKVGQRITSLVAIGGSTIIGTVHEAGVPFVWECDRDLHESSFPGQREVFMLAASPEGENIAAHTPSPHPEGYLELWRFDPVTRSFGHVDTWFNDQGMITKISFSPDGERCFTASATQIQGWRVPTKDKPGPFIKIGRAYQWKGVGFPVLLDLHTQFCSHEYVAARG